MDQEREDHAPKPAPHPASGCAKSSLVIVVLAAIPMFGMAILFLAVARGGVPLD